MAKVLNLIILIIFLVIGIIHGFIRSSINIFFSWLLIGFWILFTFKFIQKLKNYREYNSPHNTSFFIFGPLIIGFFYNFWGYFTGLLYMNLLESIPLLYISPWIIIFSLPYLLYSLYILYACFKKFDVVYLFRSKPMGSRQFGIFLSILILFISITFIILINIIFYYLEFIVTPINTYSIDLILVILIFFTSIFMLYGIFGAKRSIPRVSSDYIARRRRAIDTLSTTPIRTTTRKPATRTTTRTTTRRPTPTTTRTTTRKPATRTTTRTATRKPATRTTTRTTTRKPATKTTAKTAPSRKRTTPSISFERLKPKAGILSLEDFKCIFCFKLPQTPTDDKRGIILCPICKHPAHADEFKEWLKSSNLCSRCDQPIPSVFRRNPKIIPAKQYSAIIKEFSRR